VKESASEAGDSAEREHPFAALAQFKRDKLLS
jgi:hypothetical protein